jgi:hypothetical protein
MSDHVEGDECAECDEDYRLVKQAVVAAASRQLDEVELILVELLNRGSVVLYSACCVWAEMMRKFGPQTPPDATLMLRVSVGGAPVDPEVAAGYDAELVWAARFAVAWLNRDKATCLALFKAVEADVDSLAGSVTALVCVAAHAVVKGYQADRRVRTAEALRKIFGDV